jgi:Amt family ammonium transporter
MTIDVKDRDYVNIAIESTLTEIVSGKVIWSGVVAFICYKLVDLAIGLRVKEEDEREGLDTTAHGERAYNL